MISIVVGAYKLSDFVALNLCMCREIFPDAHLLVSDDKSEHSEKIEDVAADYGAAYVCSSNQRGHTSGDSMAFVNGAVFATANGTLCLKLSQRFIPCHQEFRTKLLAEVGEGFVAVVPGRLKPNQICRPQAAFYGRFSLLSDVVLFDPKILTPAILKAEHDEGFNGPPHNLFPEVMLTRLMGKFPAIRRVDWMANSEPMQPKLYLRKSGSTQLEYIELARKHGIKSDCNIGEWKSILGSDYKCIPVKA